MSTSPPVVIRRHSTPASLGGLVVLQSNSKADEVEVVQTVRLFGIDFLVNNADELLAPSRWYLQGSWQGKLIRTENSIAVGLAAEVDVHSLYRLTCSITVALEYDAKAALVAAREQPPQTRASFFHFRPIGQDPGTAPMYLGFGFSAIEAPIGSLDWLSSSEGEVRVAAPPEELWGADNIPVSVSSGSGGWLLNLGTSKCFLRGEVDALRLAVACIDPQKAETSVLAEFHSEACDVDLTAPPSLLICRFATDDESEPFSLSVERASDVGVAESDELVATYQATGFSLEANWSLLHSEPVLMGLTIGPARGADSFQLNCFGLAQQDGTPVELRVPGTLPLWIRPGDAALPGSVLLGADPASAGELTIVGTECQAWDENLSFTLANSSLLNGVAEEWPQAVTGLSPQITKAFSFPYLEIEAQPVTVRVARDGRKWRDAAYQYDVMTEVGNWVFQGDKLRLPICPKGLLEVAGAQTVAELIARIEPGANELAAVLWDNQHDTRFHDQPTLAAAAESIRLFGAGLPFLKGFAVDPTISDHESTRKFGVLGVSKFVMQGERRKFDIILRGETSNVGFDAELSLEMGGRLLLPAGPLQLAVEAYMQDWPVFLAVYDASLMVAELLESKFHGNVLNALKLHCSTLFDTDLFPRGWIGAIVFGINASALSGTEFELALGTTFPLGFAAITEAESGATSVYAAQANLDRDDPPPRDLRTLEAALDVRRFELLVINDRLMRLSSEMRLTIWTMLGLSARGGEVRIALRASLDSEQLEIRAALEAPEVILSGAAAPVAAVRLVSAYGRTFDEGGYGLAVSAEIQLAPLLFGSGMAWLDTPADEWLEMRNIIFKPKIKMAKGQIYFEPKYGSLVFKPGRGHFHLSDILGASVKLTALGISWDGSVVGERAQFHRVFSNDPPSTEILWFEAELAAGELAALALTAGEDLVLKFHVQVGLTNGEPDPDRYWAGVAATAIRNLSIGLYRFVALKAANLELKRTTFGSEDIPYLDLINAELVVAGRAVVSGISARIFIGRDGRGGFLVCWEPGRGPGLPHWVVAGHNVRLHDDMLKDIMDPNPNPGTTSAIQKYFEVGHEDGVMPRGLTTGRTDVPRWVLAAAFDVKGLFDLKVLLSDEGYAGLTISGASFAQIFGIGGLSVMYVRGTTPDDDRFSLAISLPKATVGPFSFMGGTLQVQVTPAGDFLFDFGFPWMRKSGLREWERTVGAIIGGLQASGGLYLERRASHGVSGDSVEVRAGYAVQWGIGGVAKFGPARASFRAGYFAIVEGLAKVSTPSFDLEELKLVGAGGVVLQAEASIDLWVVSARISILASAEALVAIDWRKVPLIPADFEPKLIAAGQRTTDVTIQLRLIVGIRIHAEVTVDLWFASHTYRVDAEVSVDMSTHIKV